MSAFAASRTSWADGRRRPDRSAKDCALVAVQRMHISSACAETERGGQGDRERAMAIRRGSAGIRYAPATMSTLDSKKR